MPIKYFCVAICVSVIDLCIYKVLRFILYLLNRIFIKHRESFEKR